MPTYKVAGISVQFPYDAYDCQLVYMERVISSLQQGRNALLESPTGTGKTLCLLCATLAWRESLIPLQQTSQSSQRVTSQSSQRGLMSLSQNDSEEALQPKLPTIVYSSRTHSQLQQVIRELKATVYRPKMVVLGSREQMCIHREVQNLRGRAQNHACRSLTKGRNCKHYNGVADYAKNHPQLGEEPIDIEDLVKIGKTEGPCPYFLSRELHNSADILFVPYNYLIEKEMRRSLTGVSWGRTILIFDEAHNLARICADAASFDLPAAHLATCIAEASSCVDLALARRGSDNAADTSIDPDNFAVLKALLLELEKRINEVPIESELGFTRPGPYIYEFLAEIKITYETVSMLIDTIDQATALLEDEANERTVGAKSKAGGTGTMYRLSTFRDALRIIFRDNNVSHAGSYKVHIHEQSGKDGNKAAGRGNKKGRMLSWWCFNPGLAMEEFSKMGVRSVILTSGTLAPLESFAIELNLAFDVRLENPHVIDASQVWVGVVSNGPSGRPLNSSYRSRDSIEYKLELGNTIVNFARIVPDGVLVFFPSYYLLNSCIEAWQTVTSGPAATVWERICRNKQPVVEPKESALFNQANEDFVAKINDPTSTGAIFFAVCRGKVSEGLDFADRSGRAVVVTGIPFAMKMDPKVRLKREFLDEQARSRITKHKVLTGEEWYVQQASRAVNQAVGRVIRHRNDYGAIILCDERFGQSGPQSQMSLWLRPYIKTYHKFGDAAFSLTRFFKDRDTLGGPLKPSSAVGTATGGHDYTRVVQQKNSTVINFALSLQSSKDGAALEKSGTSIGGLKNSMPAGSIFLPRHHEDTGALASRESLSALLAADRVSKSSQPLKDVAITAANCAVGSTAGLVHLSGGFAASKGVMAGQRILGPNPSRRLNELQSSGGQASTDHSRPPEASSKPDDIATSYLKDIGSCPCIGPKASNRCKEETEVAVMAEDIIPTDQKEGTRKDAIPKDDKNRRAANFLKEVKGRLSSGEYKGFLECMRGLKNQSIDMNRLLQSVGNYFSAPERLYLLRSFGEFVPSKHRAAYENLLAAKHSARGVPLDNLACQNSSKQPVFGFPSRSRKLPPTLSPSETRPLKETRTTSNTVASRGVP
ncbi:regulator of telomere elongation helicase 1 homolog isoform X3 [Physcomitrium patens]|uniref:regulator of telomere elongation helicase 1 homolog isoform X3 n=1 Tax=Physcomitrium patens TaxID=3218 RepID=UPI003CCCDC84